MAAAAALLTTATTDPAAGTTLPVTDAAAAPPTPPPPPPPYTLLSITPRCGSIAGDARLVLRGRQFVERGLKVQFCGTGGKIVSARKVHFVSRTLIEVVCPDLTVFRGQKKPFARVQVACAGRDFTTDRRYFKFKEKCQIVRTCLKPAGHDGRCCSDEGPPIYGTQTSTIRLNGGRFGTALMGTRTRPIRKRADSMPMYAQPKRPSTPGGRFGNALVGTRTLRIKKDKDSVPQYAPLKPPATPGGKFTTAKIVRGAVVKPNSLPGPRNPPGYGVIPGGHFGTAGVGFRTRPIAKRDGVPQYPPPKRPAMPGGRFNTAKILRGAVVKPNSLPGPLNPPTWGKIPGGNFSTALIGSRTGPAVSRERSAHSGVAAAAQAAEARAAAGPLVELPAFGSDTPGGHFNMHGARKRSETGSGKRPQSAPMYRIKGCGETRLPGGHFNKSGAHKEMFRVTYLDEAG